MKKIGMLDYYLDEFHANHFPQWIAESKVGKKFELSAVYAEKNREGGLTTEEWCKKYSIQRAKSIEELVDKCDCIIVAAPDEAHSHERLSEYALKSGKPVYLDKILADDLESGKRIIENARRSNSPMYASSALRFFKELKDIPAEHRSGNDIEVLSLLGAAPFDVYIVHQIEMMVTLCGPKVRRIKNVGTVRNPILLADCGGTAVTMTVMGKIPFAASIGYSDKSACYLPECTEFFRLAADAMLEFFLTCKAPCTFEDCLCVLAAHTAAHIARNHPDEWIDVEL